MVATMVFPLSRASLWRTLTIPRALKLSRPEVGSSSMINEGSVTSSTPIAVRFLSPPEIVRRVKEPIWLFMHCSRPNVVMSSSTLWFWNVLDPLSLSRAANSSASFTVKYSKRTSVYMTYAPYQLNIVFVNGKQSLKRRLPLNSALLFTFIRPLSAFSNVVLPAPDAPIMKFVYPGTA